MSAAAPNPEISSEKQSEINQEVIEQFLTSQALPNERQQDKLLLALDLDNSQILSQSPISITPERRQQLITRFTQGEMAEQKVEEVLRDIIPKIYDAKDQVGAEAVFRKIQGNRQILGIMAQVLKNDFEARNQITADDLHTLLDEFPLPDELIVATAPLIAEIQFLNGDQKAEAYKTALADLLKTVYGKRFEYYQQYLLLKEVGAKNIAEKPKQEEKLEVGETFAVTEINAQEASEIMKRVSIHGDLFDGQQLTPEILTEQGLTPKYRMEIGEKVLWFSSAPYRLDQKRLAVVAYVESGDQIIARSYYRSNSAGIWRYLPSYEAIGSKIYWFAKGYGEESLSLPFQLQRALAEISQRDSAVLEVENPDLILAGTARDGSRNGTYEQEIAVVPERLPGNFHTGDPLEKIPPQQAEFSSKEASPNFGKVLATWEQYNEMFGNVTVEVFASHNNQFNYTFCRDELGRVWIASVESGGPILSTGLKQQWIDGGSITTPVIEYTGQDDSYGNYRLRKGDYVDMYRNYLSKIPVIREYIGARLPAFEHLAKDVIQKLATLDNFEALYKLLQDHESLLVTLQQQNADTLVEVITAVRKGELKLSFVTRQWGLRQKVQELMELEQLRKNI